MVSYLPPPTCPTFFLSIARRKLFAGHAAAAAVAAGPSVGAGLVGVRRGAGAGGGGGGGGGEATGVTEGKQRRANASQRDTRM